LNFGAREDEDVFDDELDIVIEGAGTGKKEKAERGKEENERYII
jgi:hypothetical protein